VDHRKALDPSPPRLAEEARSALVFDFQAEFAVVKMQLAGKLLG
jgi:hypothetical protein